MTPELQRRLKEATEEQLRKLVEAAYGINTDVDQRIESILLGSDLHALAHQLKDRINSIARSDRYIDYQQAAEFSRTLNILVEDIARLIEAAPRQAFELIDSFMSIHERIYERVDDSGGDIGGSYSQALEVWLKAARCWRGSGDCPLDLTAVLTARHNDNGYAVWDDVIAKSGDLLTKDELMQLSGRFENVYHQAQAAPSDRDYNSGTAKAALGIAAVAKALGDVNMFERYILMRSPKPNELQKQSIINFCLSVNDGESALKWLQGTWDKRFASERLSLLDATYTLLGRHHELLALRREAYQRSPDHWRLKALLEILPENEKPGVEAQAIINALKISHLQVRIDTLIACHGITEAKEQLLKHIAQLNVFYGTLLDWAEVFHQAQEHLAEAACYRLLIEDILASGRSKAYHHAEDYYRQLARLDAEIERYDPLPSWQEYQVKLRQQHGRKKSFWQRAV
ncbi:hypothetical protein GTU79_21920 [Sodalis ligni]|uniref:DUF6880 family protein n=1 Tax=Sodalis ligni TaxID=2697027 RepID=UPI001BDEE3A3|nr:DUF6880 family protein [Sodalis ligni]QWA09930.1 hypothetical protein GTU79_21920 [Sodalis ligni]